jgi:hypothetical protein
MGGPHQGLRRDRGVTVHRPASSQMSLIGKSACELAPLQHHDATAVADTERLNGAA